ncbi:serine hydrolase [Sporosarcina oncorhynchi]|uniref:Serine hydrolase n=1 Tax=Sporosarcina oncorhynchi TaxID=3056444 RepID=A0ABZ0L3L4_9BACL|nr:serine hydrolase [Sporosarcina sp. T2O-4]WOV87060.1 serine hydrolase [Sporosarcina sp. T2O-4]
MKSLREKIEARLEDAKGTWSVAVEDLTKGEAFSLNGNESFYAASVIKVPIMAAVFAAAEEGVIRLGDCLPLRRDNIVGGSGVLQFMSPGIELPIYDLITLMIIQSDNTATNMLIDLIGTEKIQAVMNGLGMERSEIHHKLMIVQANRTNSNDITAADITALLTRIARGECVSLHASEQMVRILKQQQLSNGLADRFPATESTIVGAIPQWEFAGKTGTVEGIMHECALLYVHGRCVAVTVLSKGCTEVESREMIAQIGSDVYMYSSRNN